MSELFWGIAFSSDKLEGLAKLISSFLPKSITVTVSATTVYEDGLGDDTEFYSYDPEYEGALALVTYTNERRIREALDEVDEYDDWEFDSQKNPVMMFSVGPEEACHGIISVTLSSEIKDGSVKEAPVLNAAIGYIDDRVREDYGVYAMNGSLLNSDVRYSVFFDE